MSTKRLYKSRKNKKVEGVCGGIAEYFNIDPTIVRLLFLFFLIYSCFTALFVYIAAAVIMPAGSDQTE